MLYTFLLNRYGLVRKYTLGLDCVQCFGKSFGNCVRHLSWPYHFTTSTPLSIGHKHKIRWFFFPSILHAILIVGGERTRAYIHGHGKGYGTRRHTRERVPHYWREQNIWTLLIIYNGNRKVLGIFLLFVFCFFRLFSKSECSMLITFFEYVQFVCSLQ